MGYIIHTCLNMPLVVRGRHLRLLECCHAGDSVDSPIFSAGGLAGSPRHWRTKWWEILRQKLVGEAEEKLKKEQKHHVFSCFFMFFHVFSEDILLGSSGDLIQNVENLAMKH